MARRVSSRAHAAGQSCFHIVLFPRPPFLRIGMIAVAWRSMLALLVGVIGTLRGHGADLFGLWDLIAPLWQERHAALVREDSRYRGWG